MKQLSALLVLVLAVAVSCQSTPSAAGADSPAAAQVLTVMKSVADWQLVHPSPSANKYTEDAWTYGAFYAGVMALADISDDPKYDQAMQAMGQRFHWKPAK